MSIKPRRVFITCASSGLGAALARHYARQGAVLGLVARREQVLQSLTRDFPDHARPLLYALDVNDHAALRAAAEDFLQQADGVDIVIACAGISRGTLTECEEDMDVFARILDTNVMATVATFSPFIEIMRQQAHAGHEDGRLVGIASVAGIRGLPGAGAYSASKAAVISYCESLRVELKKDGVRVVTIAPGYIDTPMTQVNDYAMPFLMPVEDFAQQAAAAIAAGKSYCVLPWQMGLVARLLRLLPNSVYDYLFRNAPRKKRTLPEVM